MEQLNRWADNVCMCTFYLPASFSATGFQGAAGRQNPRFFTIMCATHLFYSLSRPSITLLSLSRRKTAVARTRLCRGKGPGGRTDGKPGGPEVRFWQHTERTLADDCHTATSW